jgi:hypothetical protein
VALSGWLGPPYISPNSFGKIILDTSKRMNSSDSFDVNNIEWFAPKQGQSYRDSWKMGEELFQNSTQTLLIGRFLHNYAREYIQLNEDSSLSMLLTDTALELIALQWYYSGNKFFMSKIYDSSNEEFKLSFNMLAPKSMKKLIILLSKNVESDNGKFEYSLTNSSFELFELICCDRITWKTYE